MHGLSLLTLKVQYARLPSSRVTVNSVSGLVGEQAAGSPRSGDVSACTSMSGPEGMASARPRAGPTGCADDIAGLCKGAATAGTLPTCRCSVVSIGPELKTAPAKGELQLYGDAAAITCAAGRLPEAAWCWIGCLSTACAVGAAHS